MCALFFTAQDEVDGDELSSRARERQCVGRVGNQFERKQRRENLETRNLRKYAKWRGFFEGKKGNRSEKESIVVKWNLVELAELRGFCGGIGGQCFSGFFKNGVKIVK